MNHAEHALHMSVARFLDAALPEDVFFWHTPNQGQRSARDGAKLKALGLRPGFPDLAIAYQGRLYCIELKAPGGTLSKAQKATRTALERAGVIVSVCYSLEAVEGCLTGLGIPLKARIAA